MLINVNPAYQFLYKPELDNYREIIFWGGRGSGKTFELTQFLIFKAIIEKCNILCLREYSNINKSSLVSEFRSIIENNDLEIEFKEKLELKSKEQAIKILVSEIKFLHNGSKIIFGGINDRSVVNLKSISNIKYCWIDEAVFLSEYAHRILKPTIRGKNSKIFYTFNPIKRDDFLYKKALDDRDPLTKSVKVNYYDNLQFPAVLNIDRENDKKILNPNIYAHIWEGETLDYNDSQVIDISKIGFFDNQTKQNYSKIIVSVDTAMSLKNGADYSAIGLFGVEINTRDIHLLHMERGHFDFYTLLEKIKMVCEKTNLTGGKSPSVILVEEKANGLSVIQELQRSTYIGVKGVAPLNDKLTRTFNDFLTNIDRLKIPMHANILNYWIGDFLLECKSFRADNKHEHDDMIDCVSQALKFLVESKTLLKLDYFEYDKNFSFVESENNNILGLNESFCILIKYSICSNSDTEKRILITDCQVFDVQEIQNILDNLSDDFKQIPNIDMVESLSIFNAVYYDLEKKIDDLVFKCLPLIQNNKVMFVDMMPKCEYRGLKGEILKQECLNFDLESKQENIIISTFLNLIKEFYL